MKTSTRNRIAVALIIVSVFLCGLQPWIKSFVSTPTKDENIRGWHSVCERRIKPTISSNVTNSMWADKYEVKSLVIQATSKIQGKTSDPVRVAKTYTFVDDASRITDEFLRKIPAKIYLMKANHMSGGVFLVNGTSAVCLRGGLAGVDVNSHSPLHEESVVEYLRRMCFAALQTPYGFDNGESWYIHIRRKCIFEEAFPEAAAPTFRDYKVWVMNNDVMFVQIDSNRFGGHRRDFVTPSWQRIFMTEPGQFYHPPSTLEELGMKPPYFGTLLMMASTIAASMQVPHVRVDFFGFSEGFAFAEATFAHDSCKNGISGFEPVVAENFYGYVQRHPNAGVNPESILDLLKLDSDGHHESLMIA
jgi:hypothetical protein